MQKTTVIGPDFSSAQNGWNNFIGRLGSGAAGFPPVENNTRSDVEMLQVVGATFQWNLSSNVSNCPFTKVAPCILLQ